MVQEPTTPVNPMMLTIVRYVLTAIGGIAVNKGLIDNDTMLTIVSAGVTIGLTAYGAFLSYRNSKAIKDAAQYVPDRIIESK